MKTGIPIVIDAFVEGSTEHDKALRHKRILELKTDGIVSERQRRALGSGFILLPFLYAGYTVGNSDVHVGLKIAIISLLAILSAAKVKSIAQEFKTAQGMKEIYAATRPCITTYRIAKP